MYESEKFDEQHGLESFTQAREEMMRDGNNTE